MSETGADATYTQYLFSTPTDSGSIKASGMEYSTSGVNEYGWGGEDWVIRVQESDASGEFLISYAETAQLADSIKETFDTYHFALETLSWAICSQFRLLEYNSVYFAFLLNQMTEDEFEDEADKYLVEPRSIDHSELASRIKVLIRHTGLHFAPSDLTDLFDCDRSDIDAAIATLATDESAVTAHLRAED